ncbi:MAG: response regulator transcription factor [Candidatus Limnocylindria bacterium]
MVVEDDRTLRQALTFNLEREGYDVASAVDGEQALAAGRDQRHDLILLDLMLPGMSGLEVLRTLRREGIETPVIILSAKGEEVDRVVGLKVGADDYVPKPFSRPELLARVEAVLRREGRAMSDSDGSSEVVTSGTIRVDIGHREVTVGNEPLALTAKEFDLLAHLAAHPGRIFTRHQLLARIWGFDYDGTDRTVDVHVSWLRTKLRAMDGHDYFRTVRGVGYAFRPRT